MTEDGKDQRQRNSGRREYDDPNKALNEHIEENDRRLRRFFIGALIAFSIVGLATTVSLIGFGIVLHQQQDTSNQLKEIVAANKHLVSDIQRQRRESITDECTAQNARHNGAVKALNEGAAHDIAHHKELGLRAGEIERRKAVTIALLDALQPVQDCQKLVRDSVQGG